MTNQTPNNPQFPHYRPVTQGGQQNLMNKSFNTPQMKGQVQQNQGDGQSSSNSAHYQNRTMTGLSGFGRFS